MKFLIFVFFILTLVSCSHHDEVPSAVVEDPDPIVTILSREQKPIMSKNAHYVAGYDMIFYANKYMFQEGLKYFFEYSSEDSDNCGMISSGDYFVTLRCKNPTELKVILYSTDPGNFAFAQKEEVIQVVAQNNVPGPLTEKRLYPEGRSIPDTSEPPVFDDNPIPDFDGEVLYASYCFTCHGNMAQSTVDVRTLEAYNSALQSVSLMRNSAALKELSDEQIQAIMASF